MYAESEILLTRREQKPRGGRIAYIPFEDMGNAYTERMREVLATFASVEGFVGVKSLLLQLPRSLRRYDAIVVNWMDNAIAAAGSGRIAPLATVKLFAKTLLMKPFAKRLVFVRHNNYPHHTAPGSERAAQKLTDLYGRLFDAVVTHSGAGTGQAQGRGSVYCPHPLYRRAVPLPDNAPSSGPSPHDLPADYFLVFGRIVPYKKIDALVEAFPSQRTLVVAGIVGDADYADRLAALQKPNFIFLPGRLDEAEAQRLVRAARGVVIANADDDVVVSGTFFYALSLACPVFAVRTPFLDWVGGRVDHDLLVLGADLKQLCRAIALSYRSRTNGDADIDATTGTRESIEREFGDAAVRAALGEALGEALRQEVNA